MMIVLPVEVADRLGILAVAGGIVVLKEEWRRRGGYAALAIEPEVHLARRISA
jgi:hypothetical protein